MTWLSSIPTLWLVGWCVTGLIVFYIFGYITLNYTYVWQLLILIPWLALQLAVIVVFWPLFFIHALRVRCR